MEFNSMQGQRLKKIREVLGITQPEIAKLLGISTRQVVNLENSESLKALYIETIAIRYGISRSWFIAGEGDMFEKNTSNHQINSGSYVIQANGDNDGSVGQQSNNLQFDTTFEEELNQLKKLLTLVRTDKNISKAKEHISQCIRLIGADCLV